jgi:ABC-type uncharacterized transport system YnjBCD permease subunit
MVEFLAQLTIQHISTTGFVAYTEFGVARVAKSLLKVSCSESFHQANFALLRILKNKFVGEYMPSVIPREKITWKLAKIVSLSSGGSSRIFSVIASAFFLLPLLFRMPTSFLGFRD